MTTKLKIILGFSLMAIMIGCIALLSYKSIEDASDGFNAYRRLARLNVATSDLNGDMYAAGFYTSQFLLDREVSDFEEARKSTELARSKIKDCMDLVVKPERRAKLEAMTKDLTSIQTEMDVVRRAVPEAYEQYSKVVQPGARKMQDQLVALASVATKAGNIDAMSNLSEVWRNFSNLRSALSRFAESRAEADAKRVRGHLLRGDGPTPEGTGERAGHR